MPLCPDIRRVLVIGAGPIVIGQGCEFDYSGTQACRTLRKLGLHVALLNSNPATIMTDPGIANATYIEPVDAQSAASIIAAESIDAVLPTMGGQTALNCAMALWNQGVVAQHRQAGKPLLIGASPASIHKAESRAAFKTAMEKIGLRCAPSRVVSSWREAQEAVADIGFPIVARPCFTLGGSGGGMAYNSEEFEALIARGLSESSTRSLLLERSLIGWKEFEMEVVRDSKDNCIIVCCIENVDPMGVHTGDSITVAPAQTLTDKEYQIMRDASIAVLREVGVDTGGANVQFAINPNDGDMVVIEMNPRVSRSSALASKATGFPIAKVATLLAVGFTLDEIANDITGGKTPASFEPSIDYMVTKVPRFDFAKFPTAVDRLSTQMQSVGEVMAIGGNFAESLQKALRGLEIGRCGLVSSLPTCGKEVKKARDNLRPRLSHPHSMRIFDIGDAFRLQMGIEEVHHLTHIDRWFLAQIKGIIDSERDIATTMQDEHQRLHLSKDTLRQWKAQGFSDAHIDRFVPGGKPFAQRYRATQGVAPVFKRIDTVAGEFATQTAYMYSTYTGTECELQPSCRPKVVILGSGPNRIGQGLEFDYCCVHAVLALRDLGYETIMINCNPETVSTDYDTADRLFFEPLTAEDVLAVIQREAPQGVIVQCGGQTPLSIAHALKKAGAPIIGTGIEAIDIAESRDRFATLLARCGLRQPDNAIVGTPLVDPMRLREAVLSLADKIGYPLVVRPSYVLGGRAMRIIYDRQQMLTYIEDNADVLRTSEVLLDRFLDHAVEVDVDVIGDSDGNCLVAGIMQHVECAGVHSGDSACCLPPHTLSESAIEELRRQACMLAQALQVVGLMNIQFAIREGVVYVLEANPRASRTVPFVSKATGVAVAKVAAKVMVGVSLAAQQLPAQVVPAAFSVKEAVFPFNKFPRVDVLLGPEMRSTGESMGLGNDFETAFLLSQEAIAPLPDAGVVAFSVRDADKARALVCARLLAQHGYTIVATRHTAAYFRKQGVAAANINKVAEGRPHIVDEIVSGGIQVVINTEGPSLASQEDSFTIRRSALNNKVVYFTTAAGMEAAVAGMCCAVRTGRPPVRSLQAWYNRGKYA